MPVEIEIGADREFLGGADGELPAGTYFASDPDGDRVGRFVATEIRNICAAERRDDSGVVGVFFDDVEAVHFDDQAEDLAQFIVGMQMPAHHVDVTEDVIAVAEGFAVVADHAEVQLAEAFVD